MKKTYIVEIFIVTIVIAISALYLILSPFIGLMGAGTLGGFDDRVFSTSKVNMQKAVETLFIDYPTYKIPEKWKDKNNWAKRGYGFLDTHIFYMKNSPEEMYYVSFHTDTNQIQIYRDSSLVSNVL